MVKQGKTTLATLSSVHDSVRNHFKLSHYNIWLHN